MAAKAIIVLDELTSLADLHKLKYLSRTGMNLGQKGIPAYHCESMIILNIF